MRIEHLVFGRLAANHQLHQEIAAKDAQIVRRDAEIAALEGAPVYRRTRPTHHERVPPRCPPNSHQQPTIATSSNSRT